MSWRRWNAATGCARACTHGAGGSDFFREGTHQLCDARLTGQLLPETCDWITAAERAVAQGRLAGLVDAEIAENVRADERACHLELKAGTDAAPFARLADAGRLTGLSVERADRPGVEQLAGIPSVTDVLHAREGDSTSTVRLRRDARAFFQGNRFLLEPLVRHVVGLVPPGLVVDLYAGVGLFGLSLAAAGAEDVTLVEGDPVSAADLKGNAEPFTRRVRVARRSVEAFLGTAGARSRPSSSVATRRPGGPETFIVDPPRTGMSNGALGGLVERRPARIIYVSCDIATLARDTRTLIDAGYELGGLTGIDLFPKTAHVETIATFLRPNAP